jgi:hypothetical protein
MEPPKSVSLGERVWFAISSPHPYMLLSMALGILVNDSQFPVAGRHWVMDAMAILSGAALLLVQWKANPNAPTSTPGNAVNPGVADPG